MGAYESSKRIFYLDQLRALAIILVILVHVCRTFARNFTIGSFNWIFTISFFDISVMGVPIFLMISGALLLGRDYTLSDFIKRRFSRILIPFIFWAILLPFVKVIFLGRPLTFQSYEEMFFLKQYWFIWMLLGAYLLMPILNSFIKEFEMKGLVYLLILWFLAMLFMRDFSFSVVERLLEVHPMGWKEIFAGYFGFFPLGYYLSLKKFKYSDKQMALIGLILLIAFTVINIVYTVISSTNNNALTYFSYRTVISTMQCIGLFIFIKYFSDYCEGTDKTFANRIYSFFKDTKVSYAILSISICSYGMYHTHYFWLYPLEYVSNNIFPIFTQNPVLLIAVLAFVTLMSWITVWVLNKIPILRYFSGAH